MQPLLHRGGQRLVRCAPRALALVRRHGTDGHGRGTDHPAPPGATRTPSVPVVSRMYQPANLREGGQESELTCRSQRLMQQAGLIHPSSPGCYYYLPATVRAMEKLVRSPTTRCHWVVGLLCYSRTTYVGTSAWTCWSTS